MKRLQDMTEPELGSAMTITARLIERIFADLGVERPHFCLLVFNDPALAQYVANCERPDIIRAMRECADRLAAKEDIAR